MIAASAPVGGSAAATDAHGTVVAAERAAWLDGACGGISRGWTGWRWSRDEDRPITLHQTISRTDWKKGSMFHITVVGHLGTAARYVTGFECLWVDFDADGVLDRDERARAYAAKHVPLQRLHDGRRKLVFDIWVPRANELQVCGRSYRPRLAAPPARSRQESMLHSTREARWTASYSQRTCVEAVASEPPEPPAEVPESSSVPLLAVSGGATAAVVLGATGWQRRRRRRR